MQHKEQNMQKTQEKCMVFSDHMKQVTLFCYFQFNTLIVLALHIVLSKLIALKHKHMQSFIQRSLLNIYDGGLRKKL